jgi:hypothetical protein
LCPPQYQILWSCPWSLGNLRKSGLSRGRQVFGMPNNFLLVLFPFHIFERLIYIWRKRTLHIFPNSHHELMQHLQSTEKGLGCLQTPEKRYFHCTVTHVASTVNFGCLLPYVPLPFIFLNMYMKVEDLEKSISGKSWKLVLYAILFIVSFFWWCWGYQTPCLTPTILWLHPEGIIVTA